MEETLTLPQAPPATVSREPARKRWLLDRSGFDALLAVLDSDRDVAAERYAALRERLSRFFAWNHAEDPDAQADEVLDRLTRRVAGSAADDEAVRQPEKFAVGVARMLLREGWRAQKANVQMISNLQMRNADHHRLEQEQRRNELLSSLLEQCLRELPEAQRDMIERYYSSDSRAQIDGRRKLAEELHISLNALRNRAMRIRGEVERKAKERLEQASL